MVLLIMCYHNFATVQAMSLQLSCLGAAGIAHLQEVKKWIDMFASSISSISHLTKWNIVLSAENLPPPPHQTHTQRGGRGTSSPQWHSEHCDGRNGERRAEWRPYWLCISLARMCIGQDWHCCANCNSLQHSNEDASGCHQICTRQPFLHLLPEGLCSCSQQGGANLPLFYSLIAGRSS